MPLPRSPRFWIVAGLVAASIPTTTLVPPVAKLLQLAPIRLADAALALVAVIAAVGWRVHGRRG